MRRTLEEHCEKFESSWENGLTPRIDQHIADCPQFLRRHLFVELLFTDIQNRWRDATAQANDRDTQTFVQNTVSKDRIELPPRPRIEDYLRAFPDLGRLCDVSEELVEHEFQVRHRWGDRPSVDEFRARFPNLVHLAERLEKLAVATGSDASHENVVHPTQIDRYRVETLLGEGGFGRVYLASDDALKRKVAIKVSRLRGKALLDRKDLYIREAQAIAKLSHPNIVDIYDVGETSDIPFFFVSKYIDGQSLEERIRSERMPMEEAVRLVATIANTLHYAHQKGIVHRDVKPANIIIDGQDEPHLVDFGLAFDDESNDESHQLVGTAPYMSPEQARGESHRVDGRADVFSLGAVFYELLVGQKPFQGKSINELLDRIVNSDPIPVRQIERTIPLELERVCLKSLSKPVRERYSTAADFAADLSVFLEHGSPKLLKQQTVDDDEAFKLRTHSANPLGIIPKGLRAFDAHDASYFLSLLPGPRSRNGLPECVRFWQQRIETDSETFSVGLIYGPSGCGKSSLVKAGILPNLSPRIHCVYVETQSDSTAENLLKSLKTRLHGLAQVTNLKEALSRIRLDQRGHSKVLIVLDQFEQWLQNCPHDQKVTLIEALRQCDGKHLQCIVLARDDFWMALTRFFDRLEIPLHDDKNVRAVDLLDLAHARVVLTLFGQAYGTLPVKVSEEQKSFVRSAVAELADDDQVICVHLALFAEMMKNKTWTTKTLRSLGGTAGVGELYLEETFGSRKANPRVRRQFQYLQRTLSALLPDHGSTIRGTVKSYDQLFRASGCTTSDQFDELLVTLDSSARLVTPVDRDLPERDAEASSKYFQLAHDSMVPVIRGWLTKQLRRTRAGRASIQMAERASAWQADKRQRDLPNLLEFVRFLSFTPRRDWSISQKEMMRRATRRHLSRGFLAAIVLVVVAVESIGRIRSDERVAALLSADTKEFARLQDGVSRYRRWIKPRLETAWTTAEENSREKLHASLTLLSLTDNEIYLRYLCQHFLIGEESELLLILSKLKTHSGFAINYFWRKTAEGTPQQERFRAFCALASLDPMTSTSEEKWQSSLEFITDHLIGEIEQYPLKRDDLIHVLSPMSVPLMNELVSSYERDEERISISLAFAALFDSQTIDIANKLEPWGRFFQRVVPEHFQFANRFAVVAQRSEWRLRSASYFESELTRTLPADETRDARDRHAQRQANSAIAILRLGQPKNERVWQLLQKAEKRESDSSARSYFINRAILFGVERQQLFDRLKLELDVSTRRALILAMGGRRDGENLSLRGSTYSDYFKQQFLTVTDAGEHSALEWVLKNWDQNVWLQKAKSQLASTPMGNRNWFINDVGDTMIVLPSGRFTMGSAPSDPRHIRNEYLREVWIDRSVAISATEVTVTQFQDFLDDTKETIGQRKIYAQEFCPESSCPRTQMFWYQAIRYCNWLSEKEGIPQSEWCYIPDAKGRFPGEGRPGKKGSIGERTVTLADNYLSLRGYRLPSEAEWEYACKANSSTWRSYGDSDELLVQYAWYLNNAKGRTHPVGLLMPNDFGFFDMHGNATEWCQDVAQRMPPSPEPSHRDVEDKQIVTPRETRCLKGRSFNDDARNLRSAFRGGFVPGNPTITAGFRVARTMANDN